MRRPSRTRLEWLLPLLVPVLFVAYWKASIIIYKMPSWYLPSPEQVLLRLWTSKTIWLHTQMTLTEMLIGFGVAILTGIVTAVLIDRSRMVEKAVYPYVIVMQAIPISAIAPMLVIWLGFGLAPRVVAAAVLGFYPIVRNTREGFKAVDYRLLELMESINASAWQVYSKVKIPTALPYIFSGLSIAAPLALIGATVAEFFGYDKGLGYLVQLSTAQFETDLSLAVVGVLAFIGISSFAIFNWIERAFPGRASKGKTQ